jgi:Cu-processing system ATP-binding protein
MPQIARYPENLTGSEIISLIKSIRESNQYNDEEILSSMKLVPEMEKPFKNLSGGTKQKISALIAFAFNPKIIILDEPTAGLDPISSSYFKDVMKQKEHKKTIILTSHLMNEVQELSDEIVFLLEGEIKFKGSVQSLLEDKKETKLERAIAELMSQSATHPNLVRVRQALTESGNLLPACQRTCSAGRLDLLELILLIFYADKNSNTKFYIDNNSLSW